MVGETSDSHPDAAVQYIYTENSYEPLARVDSHGKHADIFWYHTELNGLPDSVTDSNGETVWRGASTAWGRSLRESTPVNWDTPQNLRFQGQYLDRETGLHCNTFRYYGPAGGCYTQMDPIGLAGGLNTYTYVVDPLGWVDPLGLMCGKTTPVYRVETDVVASQRIFIDELGNITIPDRERMLLLNFGSKERAAEFRGIGDKQVKTFEVKKTLLDKLRETSMTERELGKFKNKADRNRPLRVDKKTPDQYGLRPEQINELLENIIQGSG